MSSPDLKGLLPLRRTRSERVPAAAHLTWPTRPTKIIAPSAAGGASDFVARTFAHFMERQIELLPLAAEEKIGVLVYNALAGAMLSGKYRSISEPAPENTRFAIASDKANYRDRYWHEREFATVEMLRSDAEKTGQSLATLAVAWVLANPAMTSAIIGASRPEQLVDSLKAVDFNLDASLKQRLDDLTHEYRFGDATR